MNKKSKPKRILVPVDYSDASLQVLPFAESLADSPEVELQLLHVNQPAVAYAQPGVAVSPASMATPIPPTQQQLETKLRNATELDSIPDARTKRAVVEGTPATAIVDYAKENDVDLIVMTTHGNTGLTRLLMGSVAESVVRTASCPVMTLNAGAINNDDE